MLSTCGDNWVLKSIALRSTIFWQPNVLETLPICTTRSVYKYMLWVIPLFYALYNLDQLNITINRGCHRCFTSCIHSPITGLGVFENSVCLSLCLSVSTGIPISALKHNTHLPNTYYLSLKKACFIFLFYDRYAQIRAHL